MLLVFTFIVSHIRRIVDAIDAVYAWPSVTVMGYKISEILAGQHAIDGDHGINESLVAIRQSSHWEVLDLTF